MTMYLTYASDLHLDFLSAQEIDAVAQELCDSPAKELLVLAGDVLELTSIHKQGMESFFSSVCEAFTQVLYVAGNHEFYNASVALGSELLEAMAAQYGMVCVTEAKALEIGGVQFVAGTMWTDCTALPTWQKLKIQRYMNDYKCIEEMSFTWAAKQYEAFVKLVTKERPQVVVSHHAPCESLLHPRWAGSDVNAAFGANALADVPPEAMPKLWLYGHTHDRSKQSTSDTQFLCNPRGYYEETKGWSVQTVEV